MPSAHASGGIGGCPIANQPPIANGSPISVPAIIARLPVRRGSPDVLSMMFHVAWRTAATAMRRMTSGGTARAYSAEVGAERERRRPAPRAFVRAAPPTMKTVPARSAACNGSWRKTTPSATPTGGIR